MKTFLFKNKILGSDRPCRQLQLLPVISELEEFKCQSTSRYTATSLFNDWCFNKDKEYYKTLKDEKRDFIQWYFYDDEGKYEKFFRFIIWNPNMIEEINEL